MQQYFKKYWLLVTFTAIFVVLICYFVFTYLCEALFYTVRTWFQIIEGDDNPTSCLTFDEVYS